MLQSGDTGYQLGRNETQYQQALSGAERDLLDQLTAAGSGYAATAASIASRKGEAAQSTMEQIMASNPVPPSDQAKLLWQFGQKGHETGYYGLGGNLYNAQGGAQDPAAIAARLRERVAALRAQGLHGQALRDSNAWKRLQLIKGYLPNG